MAKADPKLSEGARLERKAVLTYLRRKLRQCATRETYTEPMAAALTETIAWMVQRESRYSKRVGGLGSR